MIGSKIKLTSGDYNYYVLQFNLNTDIEIIETKIVYLVEQNLGVLTHLVLDLEDYVYSEEWLEKIKQIKNLARQYNVLLDFILATPEIFVNEIDSIPVVALPCNNPSKNFIVNKTKIIDYPVRGGIKIENDGDIILTSFMSPNAELISGGNIHIYGNACGRLIAGYPNNKKARIFVLRFHAELISIGGVYRAMEVLPSSLRNKSVQIFLDDKERLNILPL